MTTTRLILLPLVLLLFFVLVLVYLLVLVLVLVVFFLFLSYRVEKRSQEFSEEDRKELIFHIFKALVIGGGTCQFEDSIDAYMDVTKDMYKDLVGETGGG